MNTGFILSGTTATNQAGEIVGAGNPYRQTVQAIQNIQSALRALGAELSDEDSVLIKGSRSARLDQVVDGLRAPEVAC